MWLHWWGEAADSLSGVIRWWWVPVTYSLTVDRWKLWCWRQQSVDKKTDGALSPLSFNQLTIILVIGYWLTLIFPTEAPLRELPVEQHKLLSCGASRLDTTDDSADTGQSNTSLLSQCVKVSGLSISSRQTLPSKNSIDRCFCVFFSWRWPVDAIDRRLEALLSVLMSSARSCRCHLSH